MLSYIYTYALIYMCMYMCSHSEQSLSLSRRTRACHQAYTNKGLTDRDPDTYTDASPRANACTRTCIHIR